VEDFEETSTADIDRVLKRGKLFEKLFLTELSGWHTDPDHFPRKRDLKTFKEWFDVEIHSMVVDTCKSSLEAENY